MLYMLDLKLMSACMWCTIEIDFPGLLKNTKNCWQCGVATGWQRVEMHTRTVCSTRDKTLRESNNYGFYALYCMECF